jgi:hypothetical protein
MVDNSETISENKKSAVAVAAEPANASPGNSPSVEFSTPISASGAADAPKRFAGSARSPRKRSTEALGTTAKPPEVFAGGPPKEDRTIAPAPNANPGIAGAVADIMASPETLADIGQVALDGAVHAVAVWRYGKEEAQSLKASADSKKEIRRAMLAFLHASSVKMTPGQALIAAIAAAYVPAVVEMEMAGKAKSR